MKVFFPDEDDIDDPCPHTQHPLTVDLTAPKLPSRAKKRRKRMASRRVKKLNPIEFKPKRIPRNIVLKGGRSVEEKIRRLSSAGPVSKTFDSEDPKNGSNFLEFSGEYDHMFTPAINGRGIRAQELAPFWLEVKYRIHDIVKFNLRQIKFETGIELIWTDSQLTLCDCSGNSSGSVEMDSGQIHRWVWTPDFSNWLHKGWNNHGTGLRDRPLQFRMWPAEDGGRVSFSITSTITTPCARNNTWWPWDMVTCHFLGGSYSWGNFNLGSFTSEIDISDLKSNLGAFSFRVYRIPMSKSILLDADDAYFCAGIKFVAIRNNPGAVLERITLALETLVVVSLGCLCLPSIHPHADGLDTDRCTVLAGLLITSTYVYQWVISEIPDTAGDHVTTIIAIYWWFAALAPLQTTLMGLFACGCGPSCRKIVDITFLVCVLISFAYFKGYYIADMGSEILRDSCYQKTVAANQRPY